MEESYTLFSSICHSPFFEHTSFILFFNKVDILERKLENSNVNLGCFFENFNKETSFTNCLEFIHNKFRDKYEEARKAVEYKEGTKPTLDIYNTNATSLESISKAFTACEAIILKGNLSKSGIS